MNIKKVRRVLAVIVIVFLAIAPAPPSDILDFLPAIIKGAKSKKGPVLHTPVVNGSQITLTWTFTWPILHPIPYWYNLYESTSASGSFQLIAQIDPATSSYTITRNPGTYYYKVRAVPLFDYPDSNVVKATVAAQARQITIINNVGSQLLNEVVQVKVVPADGTKYSKSNDLLWPDIPTCWNLPGDNIGPGSSKTFNIPVEPPYYIFIGMGVWEPGSVYIGCPNQFFKRRKATTTSWTYYYIWREVKVNTHTGNWNWTISGSYTQQGLYVTPAGSSSFVFQATTYDPIP